MSNNENNKNAINDMLKNVKLDTPKEMRISVSSLGEKSELQIREVTFELDKEPKSEP